MKLSTAHKIGRFFQYFVLILVGVIMIYPLVWMVGATFKSNAEIFAGIGFLTANPTLQGYIDAVTQNYGGDISIWRAFINTYSFVIPKVIFTVISSVIAAYGFSRFKFKGRDMLFGIMISTLFLPQVVLNVPQYLMYNSFGWINSPFYLPLWVPTLFATETYFVYQLVQFMRSIPHDLDEAVGRIVAVFTPYGVAALLTHYGSITVFIVLGVMLLLCALVLSIFGIETRKVSLEEISEVN